MSEVSEQCIVIDWAMLHEGKYPCLRWLHAIPNGGSRNKIEAVNLKRQGVKAGVCDLFLPFAKGDYHGLYIEMKVKPNKLTDLQTRFIDFAVRSGYKAVVCYSAQEAIGVIVGYLGL